MTRVLPPAVATAALLIVLAGCLEPGAGWNRRAVQPAAKEPTPAADPTNEVIAEAPSDGEPSDPAATAARERVQEWLDRLAEREAKETTPSHEETERPLPAQADASDTRDTSYGPVVAPTTESTVAGGPTPNEALALPPAPDGNAKAAPNARTRELPKIETVVVRPSAGGEKSLRTSGSHQQREGGEESESKTVGINSALETIDEETDASIGERIERLRAFLKENPADVDAQWTLSLLLLASGQESEAIEVANGIDPESADAISDTARLVSRMRQVERDAGPAADGALAVIESLRDRLSKDAELLIPTAALCTKVSTFGVYDEMDDSMFVPHRPNRTIVYCEVKNFASEATPEGSFRVTLSSRLEILTSDGQSVWTHEEPEIVDVSKQRRSDFFLAQLVTFPATLGPGEHVLKVAIEDAQAGKATEAVVPFCVPGGALTAATKG